MSESIRADLLTISEKEKAELENELIIAKKDLAIHAAELIIANEEKAKRAAELIIANEEKAKRAAELIIANEEKAKRAAELVIANEEKAKRVAELVIANAEKARRAAELVIANSEKVKLAAGIVIANLEKAKRADELIIADKELAYQNEEKLKRAAELVIADVNKTKREAEFVIAKIEKAKWIAKSIIANKELSFLTEANSKRAAQLVIADAEKSKREAELVIANIKKANRSAELVFANAEKAKRSAELVIANKELVYLKSEKAKRAAELIIANVEKTKRAAELVMVNIEKAKRAAELVVVGKELMLSKEKEKYIEELNTVNEELTNEIEKRIQSEERLKFYMDNSPMAVVEWDSNYTITRWTGEAYNIFGWKAEEVIGKKLFILNITHEQDIPIVQKIREDIKSGLSSHVFSCNRNYRKDGSIITCEWYNAILKDENGKMQSVLSKILDITERNQTEIALKESEEKFRSIMENSADAIFIANQEGKYIYTNKEVSAMLGYTYEEMICKTIVDLSPKNKIDEYSEMFTRIIIEGKVFAEIELLKKDNNYISTDLNAVLLPDGLIYGSCRDITERKKTESELIKAKEKAEESDRLKTAFLLNMSHEIRTPMNGILGFAELLKKPFLTVEEQQSFIQIIQISGARMLNTINSIVDMSKIESGLINIDSQELNLNEKIEFTYNFFKPDVDIKGLRFIYKNGLPTNEANIKTDNEKVYGILANLVRNAIKFTYEGSIEFGYEKKGEYLEFFVKDTGIGIPQKQQQLIFERFRQSSESYTRGYEGSGLGLSISKSYVEMLGGRIWVESEEGLGSTFYFTIPYIAVSEEKTSIEIYVSEEQKEVQSNSLKILIVEDDEISYSLLSTTIQKISKEVLHAITGVEAVEACRCNPDLDLVLMDIRMPQMNGLKATQQIREFNKDVIIIAQSAYAFTGEIEKAIEAGCNDYISKPIDNTLLYTLIKKYFNR